MIAIAMLLMLGVATVAQAATEPIDPPLDNSFTQEVLRPKITPHNYYVDVIGNEVVMHFLTSYRTEGYAMIRDMESGIEALHHEGEEHTFHSVFALLPRGNYEVFAVSRIPFYGTIMTGKVLTFNIKFGFFL